MAPLFSKQQLVQNLNFIGIQPGSPAYIDTIAAYSKINVDESRNDLTVSISDKIVSDNLRQDLDEYFENNFLCSPRLLSPRIHNDLSKNSQIPLDILKRSLNSDVSWVTGSLDIQNFHSEESSKAPLNWSKTALILGSISLMSITKAKFLSDGIFSSLTVVEQSPEHLALTFSLINLESIVKQLKRINVGLNFIYEKSLPRLKESIRSQIVLSRPTSLFGILVSKTPLLNPALDVIESWLRSPEGISPHVSSFMGGEIDEVNQVLQTLYNSLLNQDRKIVNNLKLDGLESKPIVLVASGPSLNKYIPWLYKHQADLTIVASGSSLGSLLNASIKPDAVCFLERQSLIYENDLIGGLIDGYDYKDIMLIASATLDPRISRLFNHTIWFHRPISSSIAMFSHESSSRLLQSGPHCANSALEALLLLGFRKILCIGCEFSVENRTVSRAQNALGDSPRKFNIPHPGRNGKTVFSNPELLLASHSFDMAAAVYQADLFSTYEGTKLELSNPSLVDLDHLVAEDFKSNLNFLDLYNNLPKVTTDPSDLSGFLLLAKQALIDRIESFRVIPRHSIFWDKDLAYLFDSALSAEESHLTAAQIFVKRLLHQPLFMTVMPLHDSTRESWDECLTKFNYNLKKIESVYTLYIDLLISLAEDKSLSYFNWHLVNNQLEHIVASSSDDWADV